MSSDLLQSVLSNIWIVFLVVLFFGGSIFVHELGHFLAARRRGVHVDRFSIGFGPAIWSWRGRDGVEYRISWIPLGGYVLLPQLADLSTIEGASSVDATKLPPVNYATKMIVFAAGAAFNVLFAFALACIVSAIGLPTIANLTTTTIAEVLPTIKTSDGLDVVSPAYKAGLQPGDVITAIDGNKVETFDDIVERVTLSSGWDAGQRRTIFTVQRQGKTLEIPVSPVISGAERTRKVGFVAVGKVIVGHIAPHSLAEEAGLQPNDQVVAVDDRPVLTVQQFVDAVAARTKPLKLSVLRNGQTQALTLAPPHSGESALSFGMGLKTTITHPNPVTQVTEGATRTFQAISGLLNPRSDIGVRHLSGTLGMIDNYVEVARAGMPFVLWFTIVVNVNLAILNLLPVPVLDGGHMLFATIARLRGRALPSSFVMATQSVFFVLIFAFIGYVTIFVDIPRIARERAQEAATPPSHPATNSAAPAPAAPSAPAPAAPAPAK